MKGNETAAQITVDFNLSNSCFLLQVLIRCNQYVTAQEPWVLAKTGSDRLKTVLYVMIESMRVIALLLSPVMPATGFVPTNPNEHKCHACILAL